MTCDKKLYSTVIYSRWIKEADKDFDAARRVLEYEMLMSNNFTAVNCVRTLFCCRKTQNYQVMNEILNLMGDFCKDHPYVIASHIIKMVHSNAEHTEIENFINKNIEKTSENNLECIYENIADAYIETNSVKEAYKIINKALCRFPHSTIFNKIYPHNNCNNKLEFLKHFISENQDFSFLIQRACIEYLNICKSEANYSFAIDFLNIHSGIFPDNNIPIKLKANLYSRMGKFYDAYTLYKKLPDAFYIDNCDTLYLYAHTLYKLNYSEKLYALFKKCLELNLLNKGSKLIILFLDFFYSQLNLKPLSLSLSLSLLIIQTLISTIIFSIYQIHYTTFSIDNIKKQQIHYI